MWLVVFEFGWEEGNGLGLGVGVPWEPRWWGCWGWWSVGGGEWPRGGGNKKESNNSCGSGSEFPPLPCPHPLSHPNAISLSYPSSLSPSPSPSTPSTPTSPSCRLNPNIRPRTSNNINMILNLHILLIQKFMSVLSNHFAKSSFERADTFSEETVLLVELFRTGEDESGSASCDEFAVGAYRGYFNR